MTDHDDTRPAYLILGGTGGIGSALARRLTRRGAGVLLCARDATRLAELSEELGQPHRVIDARHGAEVDAAVAATRDEFDRIDGVACCVGSILLKPAHRTSDEEWADTIATNLTVAFHAVRAGAKSMLRTGGSIALVASAAGRTGLPNHEAIAAAKAGVTGLALSAAATYASRGIRVNAVAPGLVVTPLSEALLASEAQREASRGMHPLGRLGQPEEVASALDWLLDPEQSWVTGQLLGVDGGLATIRGLARR